MTLVVALQSNRLEQELDGVRRWLYLGEDTAWCIRAERGALVGLERIPTGKRLQEVAWRLLRPFVDWVDGLAQANLARGVPPVFVQAEKVLHLDQLEPYEDLRRQAPTPEHIRRACEEVAATGEAALREWRARAGRRQPKQSPPRRQATSTRSSYD